MLRRGLPGAPGGSIGTDLLPVLLELYRGAQDVSVAQFQEVALNAIQSALRFRTATWSTVEFTPSRPEYYRALTAFLYKEPPEMLSEFVSLNAKYSRLVSTTVQNAGRAVPFLSMEFMSRPEEAPMRSYVRRFAHERTLMIVDPGLRHVVSLYRPAAHRPYTERDSAVLTALLPHMLESLKINQCSLAGTSPGSERSSKVGATALVDLRGVFLHCGQRFLELLRRQWTDWSEPRVPEELLSSLRQDRPVRIAEGTVSISVRPCGSALLLTAKELSSVDMLSPRELEIARKFATGSSYKQIASELVLSPATVRNLLQSAYRKLAVSDKAALARLFERH
jgi:DNA-binding CsgD family transcriptional regulator